MTNRILYNGIKILVSNIGTKILGLINIILLSTFLSISDFGLFMLILTTINFVGLISTFSLQNVVYKTFVPVENKRTSKLNLANILMFSQISAIFFFCIIMFLILTSPFYSHICISFLFRPPGFFIGYWLIQFIPACQYVFFG